MHETYERALLTKLLKQLRQPGPRRSIGRWLLAATWLALVLFFMLLFQIAQGLRVDPIALALGSAVLGALSAYIAIYGLWARQWTYIRRHVDEQSIRARLSELDHT